MYINFSNKTPVVIRLLLSDFTSDRRKIWKLKSNNGKYNLYSLLLLPRNIHSFNYEMMKNLLLTKKDTDVLPLAIIHILWWIITVNVWNRRYIYIYIYIYGDLKNFDYSHIIVAVNILPGTYFHFWFGYYHFPFIPFFRRFIVYIFYFW